MTQATYNRWLLGLCAVLLLALPLRAAEAPSAKCLCRPDRRRQI